MSILKDLIIISIFVISLYVLYITTNHIVALLSVITITVIYLVKHIRLNLYLQKEALSAKINAKEKDEQLKCMMENMPIFAFLKDKSGRLVIGSAAFESVVGAKGKLDTLHQKDIVSEECFQYSITEDAEVYRTKKPMVVEREIAFVNQSSFLARVRKAPVFDSLGEIKYLLVMYENIESEKEIERQKEYFIETLIHDLKIPTLAQLRGLELIQNGTVGEINVDQKELLNQIVDSCKYILDMISMVLKTYRFENGQKHFVFEYFSLAELLLESFEVVSHIAQEKNVEFVYAHNGENVIIEADKADIKVVILNLLSNAVMYSNRNEKIIVNIEQLDNYLQIIISSTGITLSERECRTMFNKMTGDTPKYTTVGHGIGLYLCKKIVESHNGRICASTDGKTHNKFILTLPPNQQKNGTKSLSAASI